MNDSNYAEHKSTVGNRIKLLRKANNIDAEVMARDLGTARSTLGGWESGNRAPKGERLVEVAKYLNTTVDYLIGKTNDKEFNIPDISVFLKSEQFTLNGEKVTKEKADSIKKIIKALLSD